MSEVRVVLAPAAFKGTLTALEVAEAMRRGLADLPGVTCLLLPMADGGDGSVDAFVSAGYAPHPVRARGASGEWHDAEIALQGHHAVIELARICGIARSDAHPLRPLDATTLGVGDAMLAALDAGATRLSLCLGGSASTDGGTGLLVALGARVLDERGDALVPGGRDLDRIAHLDLTGIDPRLSSCTLEVLADVTNPLTGPEGAAPVFAPQKGASPEEVVLLDTGLAHWGAVLESATGLDVATSPGTGAAGGAGVALAALGAEIRPGARSIAQLVGLPAALASADVVVVGEGRLDDQTPHGKAVSHVISLARDAEVPVLAVCGQITLDPIDLAALGLAGWITTSGDDAAHAVADATRRLVANHRGRQ